MFVYGSFDLEIIPNPRRLECKLQSIGKTQMELIIKHVLLKQIFNVLKTGISNT
jgi:hypothetical protein